MIIAGQDRGQRETQTFWLPLCGLMRAAMIISHEELQPKGRHILFWQADYGHQTLWCVLRTAESIPSRFYYHLAWF